MNKQKILRWIALTTPVLVLLAAFASGGISSAAPRAEVKLAQSPRTVVLYTVTHGSYADAAEVFHRLVTLRNDNGLRASAKWGTFVFLSPPDTNPDRLLIEVRIPVEAGALALDRRVAEVAHAYDLGTVGVKTISMSPEIRIAKPIGVGNPAAYYTKVYNYIQSNELAVTGPPAMTFDNSEEIPEECEAAEIAATLSIPIARNRSLEDLRTRLRENRL